MLYSIHKTKKYPMGILYVVATMNLKNIKTNIFFVAPIAAWLFLLFYEHSILRTSFASTFVLFVLLGIVPYGILWIIANRFPDYTRYCQAGSIGIFVLTALIIIYFLYFTHGEQSLGILFLPLIILRIILYIILLLPFAAIIVYVKRRLRRKT